MKTTERAVAFDGNYIKRDAAAVSIIPTEPMSAP